MARLQPSPKSKSDYGIVAAKANIPNLPMALLQPSPKSTSYHIIVAANTKTPNLTTTPRSDYDTVAARPISKSDCGIVAATPKYQIWLRHRYNQKQNSKIWLRHVLQPNLHPKIDYGNVPAEATIQTSEYVIVWATNNNQTIWIWQCLSKHNPNPKNLTIALSQQKRQSNNLIMALSQQRESIQHLTMA